MNEQKTIPYVILKLSSYRRREKITQSTVADYMNTTASAIARLESGGGKKCHSPSLNTLNKYASALGFNLLIDAVPLVENVK